jgi:ABC-2 type transport system permease protein
MPIFLLVLFGYGVSLDADHVPVALVADAPSQDSADFLAALQGSHYFVPRVAGSLPEAEQALREGAVKGIIHLSADFSRRLRQADGAPIQVLVNGVDANTARLVEGYVTGAWGAWLAAQSARRGQKLDMPVDLQPRIWFNSELKSRNYLVPGLVAIIMTLIGALLTALVMAREWERGTMEALMVTPASMSEVLLGKLGAYFILGTGGMLPMSKMNPESRKAGRKVAMMAIWPATNWLRASVEIVRPMPSAASRNRLAQPQSSQNEPRSGTPNRPTASPTVSSMPPVPSVK